MANGTRTARTGSQTRASRHSLREREGIAASRHLCACDPALARIIGQVGACTIRSEPDAFMSLVRAIVYQQLAGSAADAIFGRFLNLYGKDTFPRPAQILATDVSALRSTGLSARKIEYICDLAAHVSDGRLDLASLSSLPDEEIIEKLTCVKGIGRWTAEMFLIFCLGRPDVLPVGDLGFRRAIKIHYGLEELPTPEVARKIAEPWKPYSSIATWYLWKSLEKFKGIG
ncbi:MAG: DNA-3-methyladenine glycosylase [Nitrososphaera sp.]